MGQFWCPLRLEYIPGKWIPKAMYSRHRNIDKSAGYLESWGAAENISTETDPTFEDDTVQESDNFDVKESADRPSFVPLDEPVTHCDPTELARLKEGTVAVEDTLHDLIITGNMKALHDGVAVCKQYQTDVERDSYTWS